MNLKGLLQLLADVRKDNPLGFSAACVGALAIVPTALSDLEVGLKWFLLACLFLLAVGGLLLAFVQVKSSRATTARRRLRVAVLPIQTRPHSGPTAVLGDGLTEKLVESLAQISDLEVIERQSTMELKDRRPSVPELVEMLGDLDYLLQATLVREGEEYKVHAEFHDVAKQRQAWSVDKSFRWNQITEAPRSLSEGVAAALRLQATAPSREITVLEIGTANARAFEAYSRGRFNVKQYNLHRRKESFDAAEVAFKEALAVDPQFADAHAELGFLYLIAWETEGTTHHLDQSERSFRHAVDQQEGHPKATAELGYLSFLRGDVERGVELARSAVDLAHPRTIPCNVLSLLYLYLGYYEASVALTEIVTRLDPLYTYPYTNASLACQLLGLQDSGLGWAARAGQIEARAFTPALLAGAAHFRKGSMDLAEREWARGRDAAEPDTRLLFDIVMAWIPASRGDQGPALRLREADGFPAWCTGAYASYCISMLALAGQRESALDLLEHTDLHDYKASYRYLIADDTLRPLHADARFELLLHRRFEEWTTRLERFEGELAKPPGAVPTPGEILSRAGSS